uniref:Uncharacterized protein n=1 Tax=Panagrolaimus sp. JU765 TaxID=591449 RepID=A0AC34QYJ6_9BILA
MLPVDPGNCSILFDFRHSAPLCATSLQPFHPTALRGTDKTNENMANAMESTGIDRTQAMRKQMRFIDSDDGKF